MEKQIKPVEGEGDKSSQSPVNPADTAKWPEDQEAIKYVREEAGHGDKQDDETGRLAEEAPAPKK